MGDDQKPAPDGGDALTVDQVAGLLGVSVQTVRAYRTRGMLPSPDGVFGREPWWRPETIRAWQQDRPGRGAGGGRPRKHADS